MAQRCLLLTNPNNKARWQEHIDKRQKIVSTQTRGAWYTCHLYRLARLTVGCYLGHAPSVPTVEKLDEATWEPSSVEEVPRGLWWQVDKVRVEQFDKLLILNSDLDTECAWYRVCGSRCHWKLRVSFGGLVAVRPVRASLQSLDAAHTKLEMIYASSRMLLSERV